jgi:UDP:flavonoid glycosyltransferase YjiC (YdhE family)
MRVLFTTNVQPGHWHPLVPFATALRQAGHEVAFATTPSACSAISALGFRCLPAGKDETAAEARELREQMETLPESDGAAWAWVNRFAGIWASGCLPDLVAICADWQPALVVREDLEFAGCIAAELRGLPHATVQVTAWRPSLSSLVIEPLNRLRAGVGLPPDPDLAILHRFLLIVAAPPRYHESATPLPPTAHAVRHVAFDRSGEEQLPAWAGELPDQPVVYATMGTRFNRMPGMLEAIVAGLRDDPITLILTTGRDRDPGAFGPQPTHGHIERYVPQSLLCPLCDLVVTHCGSGTVLTALGHGLPMVIVPVSADQPHNARRCQQLGVARVISPRDRTPEGFRAEVRMVLRDPSCRRNAGQLRAEMAALPGSEQVVGCWSASPGRSGRWLPRCRLPRRLFPLRVPLKPHERDHGTTRPEELPRSAAGLVARLGADDRGDCVVQREQMSGIVDVCGLGQANEYPRLQI